MSEATRYDDFFRPDADKNDFMTGSPLRWEVGRQGSGLWVTVPAGFRFNSSVPWWLHWLRSPRYRPWLLAACIHDFFLSTGFDKAFAAGEWYRAARAKEARAKTFDWLTLPAYYGVVIWTVRL